MINTPDNPTTRDLHDAYAIDYADSVAIAGTRIAINSAMAHPDYRYLLVGPCALTNDPETLMGENEEWLAYAKANGLIVGVRRHPFKPRSVLTWDEKMTKWHGLETGFPEDDGDPDNAALTAYEIMHNEATTHHNVSMEVAFQQHVDRYGPLLSFAQIGARTRDQYYDNYAGYLRFLDYLALREPTLPIGIKNDTDGSIDQALYEVDRINDVRSRIGISAVSRAVLIYRGGDNAKTPELWNMGARNAIARTRGAVILDAAHGGRKHSIVVVNTRSQT